MSKLDRHEPQPVTLTCSAQVMPKKMGFVSRPKRLGEEIQTFVRLFSEIGNEGVNNVNSGCNY